MNYTKLTIRVPGDFLDGAKRYAARHNTTLTRLVSEYLRRLAEQSVSLEDAPIVRRLIGILPPEASVEDYRNYIEEKYGA